MHGDPDISGPVRCSLYIDDSQRKINPEIFIVVRTLYLAEVEDLISIGADEVIPSEFEASIEIFSRILQFYHMPKNLIGQYADKFRKDHYSLFMRGDTPKRLFHDTLALMPDADYESYMVESGSAALNSSFQSLNIQNRTGTHLIAVRRGNKIINVLTSDFLFQKGDIVLLIGDKSSLDNAYNLFFKKLK